MIKIIKIVDEIPLGVIVVKPICKYHECQYRNKLLRYF